MPGRLIAVLLALTVQGCLDFYDHIPCSSESDCPAGYICNEFCHGPGELCANDDDCTAFETQRRLLCVKFPWDAEHRCRLSCTPDSKNERESCPAGQSCQGFTEGDAGACF